MAGLGAEQSDTSQQDVWVSLRSSNAPVTRSNATRAGSVWHVLISRAYLYIRVRLRSPNIGRHAPLTSVALPPTSNQHATQSGRMRVLPNLRLVTASNLPRKRAECKGLVDHPGSRMTVLAELCAPSLCLPPPCPMSRFSSAKPYSWTSALSGRLDSHRPATCVTESNEGARCELRVGHRSGRWLT